MAGAVLAVGGQKIPDTDSLVLALISSITHVLEGRSMCFVTLFHPWALSAHSALTCPQSLVFVPRSGARYHPVYCPAEEGSVMSLQGRASTPAVRPCQLSKAESLFSRCSAAVDSVGDGRGGQDRSS